MTLEECRTQSRELGRMDSTGLSDARLNQWVDKALDEFSNDVGGFNLDVYPAIAASFDTATHFAIRVTITAGANALAATDVPLTTTARNDTTGTIVASDFQATLRTAVGVGANITVVWANFAFTVDTIDGTEITFEAPTTVTYADARALLGLTGTTTEAGADVTGSFPEDCTMEYTIPTNAISIQRVEWDGNPLEASPREDAMSPQSSGVPASYHLRGRTLRFNPAPTQQGICEVWYKGTPTSEVMYAGYQELGLSGVSDESSSGLAAVAYTIGVSINGATSADITFTVASDDTWAAVIILMNAQTTGATWAVVGGDIRLTSDAVTGVSSIAIVAGGGTDALAVITGFTAVDTAVAGDTTLPTEIPSNYQGAIPFLVAYYLLLQQFEDKLAMLRRAEYAKTMRSFRLERSLRNTEINRNDGANRRLGYKVTM